MRPVILLTCGGSGVRARSPAATSGPVDFGPRGREGVKIEYIRSVQMAGGVPLLLPNCPDPEVIVSAVAAGAGLLLTGGGDVWPGLYARRPHPLTATVDPDRDEVERQVVREAMRRELPILGICRGIQLLNVVMGGTLIQDIPSHSGRRGDPSLSPGPAERLDHKGPDHLVRVEEHSMLAEVWPGLKLTVNSRHHQAADRLGEGLRVSARAPDGIIEAVESADGYPLLGVQCHPEDLSAERADMLAPFQWLVERAGKR